MYIYFFVLAPQNKRLALVYLANEVVQQSRAKKRDEFVKAFAKVVPEAMGFTFRQTSNADTKSRIKRVADVWRQRNIFSEDVLNKVEQAFTEPKRLGGSLKFGAAAGSSSRFGQLSSTSATPAELPAFLSKLLTMHKSLTASIAVSDLSSKTVLADYTALVESDSLPAPKEYSKKLSNLEPRLISAHANLSKQISARRDLIDQLKSLAESSESLLKEDEDKLKDLEQKQLKVKDLRNDLSEMLGYEEETKESEHSTEGSTTPPFEPPISKHGGSTSKSSTFLYEDDSEGNSLATGTSTPPAPPSDPTDKTFGGFSIVDDDDDEKETTTSQASHRNNGRKSVTFDTSAPTYASSSESEESDDERSHPLKRQKLKAGEKDLNKESGNFTNTTQTSKGPDSNIKGFEGLDPKIAQFLSSFAKGNSV